MALQVKVVAEEDGTPSELQEIVVVVAFAGTSRV